MSGAPAYCAWCGVKVEDECDRHDLDHWCRACHALVVEKEMEQDTETQTGTKVPRVQP